MHSTVERTYLIVQLKTLALKLGLCCPVVPQTRNLLSGIILLQSNCNSLVIVYVLEMVYRSFKTLGLKFSQIGF